MIISSCDGLPFAMDKTMTVTSLLVATLVSLACCGTLDFTSALLSYGVAFVSWWLWTKGPQWSMAKPTENGAAKHCTSTSDTSFSLGEPEAHFLRVSEQKMSWLEAEVGLIYGVTDEPGRGIDLTNPLTQLRDLVKPLEQEHWQLQEPLDDILLCRLLVAKDFNVEQAFALARKYLDFRLEVDGGVRPPDAWISSGMVILPFEDRHGRPVVVVRAKYIDAGISSELLAQGYRATVDAVIAYMLQKRSSSVSRSNPLEQYVLLFESEGVGWSNFSTGIVKTMVRESNNHYPERLARLYVLNCTPFIRTLFQMVSPMLHVRTVKKTEFVVPEKVKAVMHSLVEPEKLPVDYGGNALTWAGPEYAHTLSDRLGKLMAATYRRLGLEPPGEDSEDEARDRRTDHMPRTSGGGMCCW